ncbi:MAG: hypothetical protein H6772_03995 [Pseudomonadales bacterium]|nr:hypothetical protein [Pseudomonadales bacterium]
MNQDEQRILAAAGWCLNNHQIPKSLSDGNSIWNYSGSISNSELRLYEEDGLNVIINRSEVKEILPISPENRNIKYGEKKWLNGELNSKFYNGIFFLHDDMKVSRALDDYLDISHLSVRIEGGPTFSIIK